MLVVIKDTLIKNCKPLYRKNDFVIVIKLDKRLFNIDKHIILFTVYIFPCMTKYSKVELFDDLPDRTLNYDSDDYYHLICGDMNAHTEELDDIVIFDENMCEQLDIDAEIFVKLQVKETMDNLNIPSHRKYINKC